MSTRIKKKNFSSFTYREAFKYLNIEEILPWSFRAEPIAPSEFFAENLKQISEV
ncbi:MAG: hypothetical protein ACO31I_19325 [Prochlorotrichaceae cyanobacterium]|jgi:hypothetical protein